MVTSSSSVSSGVVVSVTDVSDLAVLGSVPRSDVALDDVSEPDVPSSAAAAPALLAIAAPMPNATASAPTRP